MKDYKIWTPVKIRINNRCSFPQSRHFKERDIWWASVGENIGFEEDDKGDDFLRPIIILRKFSRDLVLVVPLSKTNKEGKYYFKFKCNEKESNALLSQIKSIDSSRLAKR